MNIVSVKVGEVLMEFTSFSQWVNKAGSWFKSANRSPSEYVCIDYGGRVCTCGAHFMRADREKTFPIRVYLIE